MYVIKFTHLWVDWISPLLTCNLSCKFRFSVVMVLFASCLQYTRCSICLCHNFIFMGESTVLCSVHDVIVKQFTFAISSPDELLVYLLYTNCRYRYRYRDILSISYRNQNSDTEASLLPMRRSLCHCPCNRISHYATNAWYRMANFMIHLYTWPELYWRATKRQTLSWLHYNIYRRTWSASQHAIDALWICLCAALSTGTHRQYGRQMQIARCVFCTSCKPAFLRERSTTRDIIRITRHDAEKRIYINTWDYVSEAEVGKMFYLFSDSAPAPL